MARPWKIEGIAAARPVPQTARAILEVRIHEMYSYEPATLETDDIDALHDMRVGARRLQALSGVFRPLLPQKIYRQELRKLKGLLKDLGRVREGDVLLQMLRHHMTTIPHDRQGSLLLLVAQIEASRLKGRLLLRRRIRALRRDHFKTRLLALAARAR